MLHILQKIFGYVPYFLKLVVEEERVSRMFTPDPFDPFDPPIRPCGPTHSTEWGKTSTNDPQLPVCSYATGQP